MLCVCTCICGLNCFSVVCDLSIISGFAAEGVFVLSSRDWCVAMVVHLCCCCVCWIGDVLSDG